MTEQWCVGSIPGLRTVTENSTREECYFLYVLRGPELNRGLEVMSLPRYLSSTPRYRYYLSVALKMYRTFEVIANQTTPNSRNTRSNRMSVSWASFFVSTKSLPVCAI